MKRLELLQQSPEKLEKDQLSHQVEIDKLQAQADLLETQRQLNICKQELTQLKSAKELSFVSIINKQNQIEGFEKGVKSIESLIKELF